jgi:hypothetical protein
MVINTKLEQGEFKGKPTISIWKVNENGEKASEYPIIAFGLGKARVILDNIEEIKKFVEANPAE